MKIIAILTLGLILMMSCQKELSYDEQELIKKQQMLDTTKFECLGVQSEYYFKGRLNTDSLCYSPNVNTYQIYNYIVRHTTGGASLSTDPTKNPPGKIALGFSFNTFADTLPKHHHVLNIVCPTTALTAKKSEELLHTYLKIGDLKITDKMTSDTAGFLIRIVVYKEIPRQSYQTALWGKNFNTVYLSSNGGEQNGSFLKCTHLERKTEFGKTYYEISFDLKCKLYSDNSLDRNYQPFFGVLEGVYKTRLDI